MTLHEVLADARARLVAAGIPEDEASVDVDLFARTILGWDRARLLVDRRGPAPAALREPFSEWVARRVHHEPAAYIVGTREFWGLEFEVSPAVLIPRPETELVVEEALALLARESDIGNRHRPLVADIGTGSGCIAVSIAHSVESCRLLASDISDSALDVARRNAARHNVAHRIAFLRTSYLDGTVGPFDLVTANPPYVRERDRAGLGRAVLHEPPEAIFGGEEGVRDIGGVLDAAVRTVRSHGCLVMEFGLGQESAVRSLVSARPGLVLERVRSDLQEIPRTAIIRRS